jgi:hypothetical protein
MKAVSIISIVCVLFFTQCRKEQFRPSNFSGTWAWESTQRASGLETPFGTSSNMTLEITKTGWYTVKINGSMEEKGYLTYRKLGDTDGWDFYAKYKPHNLLSRQQQFNGRCALTFVNANTLTITENIKETNQPVYTFLKMN